MQQTAVSALPWGPTAAAAVVVVDEELAEQEALEIYTYRRKVAVISINIHIIRLRRDGYILRTV